MQLLHPGIYLGFNLGSGLFVIAVRQRDAGGSGGDPCRHHCVSFAE